MVVIIRIIINNEIIFIYLQSAAGVVHTKKQKPVSRTERSTLVSPGAHYTVVRITENSVAATAVRST